MKDLEQWVVWNFEERDGKKTKVPYSVKGGKAASTDPSTWTTYKKAKKASEAFDGIGFVFPLDGSMLGVDIDHVIENGEIIGDHKREIKKFIESAHTYTEISPSGTGLHLFFKLKDKFVIERNKKAPFEIYSNGRYFTVTENHFLSEMPVREIGAEDMLALLSIIGYPWEKKQAPSKQGISILEDNELIIKMFSSKNGEAIRALYEGDLSAYDSDESRADMALLSSLAFWTQKDAEQMERLWLNSPLGQREKTQKRNDYRKRSIANAIANCVETYSPKILSPIQLTTQNRVDITLLRSKNGIPYNNLSNAIIAVNEYYGTQLKYNEFRQEIEFNNKPIDDLDITIIRDFLQKEVGLHSIADEAVRSAVILTAHKNKYDEAQEWLKGLVWDGVPRFEKWLISSLGVEDDEYHRAIGMHWIMGMVRRIMEPGCVFDHVLLLVGKQGIGKTSFFRIIGGKWYKSYTGAVDNKDFYLTLRGAILIDLDEGAALYKTEAIKIKSIITETHDEYRAPYERITKKYPRRFVFSMSTNDTEPFRDTTGNRRYWTIDSDENVNFSWLQENRDQIFAEAYHWYMSKKELLAVPRDIAEEKQEQHLAEDPWTNAILTAIESEKVWRESINSENEGHEIAELYKKSFKKDDVERVGPRESGRIASILKKRGFLKKRVRENGRQITKWYENNV